MARLAVAPTSVSPTEAHTLSWPVLLAYGGMGLPLAFVALPIYVHVPALYAELTGLPLASIGAVLLFARLWDAVIDPLIGVLGDRYAVRWPMRKLALVIAFPLLACGLAALLRPPEGAGLIWLAGALCVVYLGYSLASVNHHAWGAELSPLAHERTRITASREGFALIGVLLASALPALLGDSLASGLAQLVWIFVVLLSIALVLCLLRVPARGPGALETDRPSFGMMWSALGRRRFRALLAVFAISGIAAAIPATLVLFFINDVLQVPQQSGYFLVIYFLAAALGLPVWVSLSRRFGKLQAWLVGMLLALSAFVWAAGLGAGDTLAFALVCVLSGLALGADLALPPSLLADVAAADDKAGAGTYFGWWNFVAKLNLALAAGLALPLLQVLGYTPGVREDSALQSLALIYALLPALLKLLAAGCLWRLRHLITESEKS